jgi:hypothetical protein
MIRPELKKYYLYLLSTIGIALVIQAVLPFPFGMVFSLGFMVMLPAVVKILMTRNGRMKGAGMFGGMEDRHLRFLCQVCGTQTKQRQCPRCGSRQFKTA